MERLRLENLERAKDYLSLAKFYTNQTGIDSDIVDAIDEIMDEIEFRMEQLEEELGYKPRKYIEIEEDEIYASEDY